LAAATALSISACNKVSNAEEEVSIT
jgi:hypothetical protein